MSNKHAVKIIALDFDGTIVTNKYPEVGEPIEKNIKRIKEEIENGAKVILWTNRVNEYLDAAVSFCNDQGIRLEAVNENLPEVIEEFGGNPRKIFANEYWDDRAVHMSEEEKIDVPSFMKKEFHIPEEVELQDVASKEFDRSNTTEEVVKRAANSCEAQDFKE